MHLAFFFVLLRGGVHQRGESKLWGTKWLHCNFEKNFENKKKSKKNFYQKMEGGGTIIPEIICLFEIQVKLTQNYILRVYRSVR